MELSYLFHFYSKKELNFINIMAFNSMNNSSIKDAVKEWFKNQKNCEEKNGHITFWDTTNVNDLSNLFSFRTRFNDLLLWNTFNVFDMSEMFYNCSKYNQDLQHLKVDNVKSMRMMFYYTKKFNKPLNNWNTSNVNNMSGMFKKALSFNQNIENWNIQNVSNIISMFNEATCFNQDLSKWNSKKLSKRMMFNTFYKCNCKKPKWFLSDEPSFNFPEFYNINHVNFDIEKEGTVALNYEVANSNYNYNINYNHDNVDINYNFN